MKKLKQLCAATLSCLLLFGTFACAQNPSETPDLSGKGGRPGVVGVALPAPAAVIDVAEYTGYAAGDHENNAYGMLAARSLQGLINRTLPRLYVERVGEEKWGIQTEPLKKDALVEFGGRTLSVLPRDLEPTHYGYHCFWSIFYKYREEINGLYVYEEYTANDRLYAIINVAVMLAARNGGIAVSRPLAEQIKSAGYTIPEVDVEAYCGFNAFKDNLITINEWAVDNLQKGSNVNMVFALNPVIRTWYEGMTESTQFPTFYDMAVALNAFIYVPIPYTTAGRELEERVLSYYSDGIPVLGWPGPYENDWVSHLAACGKGVICSDWDYGNGSLWCAFPSFEYAEKLAPIPEASAVDVDDDTVYVAFTYSDGDAYHYAARDLPAHLNNPVIMNTDIPIGWTIPASWRNFNPVLLEYVYSLRRPGLDEFMQGPSGVTYSYPSRLSEFAYETYLTDTKEFFDALGINMINYWDITPGGTNSMVGADESKLARYIEVVKPDAVFRGQSSRTGDYKYINGVLCIEEVGDFNGSGCRTAIDMVSAVEKSVERQKTGANALRPNGPVFIMVNINAWGDPIDTTVPVAVAALRARTDFTVKLVTPSALVATINKYEAGKA
jgi:hypothetical protein